MPRGRRIVKPPTTRRYWVAGSKLSALLSSLQSHQPYTRTPTTCIIYGSLLSMPRINLGCTR
jgi:hypothetical protein